MDTNDLIRDYRKKLKLSQREFSNRFNIPLSTLRKWEQKESRPSKYFIEKINEELSNKDLLLFDAGDKTYSFDRKNNTVYNNKGIGIKINQDLCELDEDNMIIILNQLFNDYDKMIETFESLCKLDKRGNSKWIEL